MNLSFDVVAPLKGFWGTSWGVETVDWKKMHNLKVENYLLFCRLAKDLSQGGARIYRSSDKKNR